MPGLTVKLSIAWRTQSLRNTWVETGQPYHFLLDLP